MSEMRVTVTTFFDATSADVAREFLEERGIETFLMDDPGLTTEAALPGLAINGIRLQVAPWDVDQAYLLLNRLKREQEDSPTSTAFADPSLAAELAEDAREEAEDNRPVNRLADRALKAAIIGVILWPVQFYASYLLVQLIDSKEAVGQRYRWRARLAALINLPAILCLPLFFVYGKLPSFIG